VDLPDEHVMSTIPPVLHRLFDDAAMFPPGNAPMARAVPAHLSYRSTAFADLVGPFVLPAGRLAELPELLGALDGVIELAVTLSDGPAPVSEVACAVGRMPGAVLRALEVVVPEAMRIDTLLGHLSEVDDSTDVYVEAPRAERRSAVIAALTGTRYRVKFRTGGARASAHPEGPELAAAICAAANAGVPFKATAGLHHAVRNTDTATGFEQHGFLNVLVATDAAVRGAEISEVARILERRDGERLAAAVRGLGTGVRRRFVSFGTCSVLEPLGDLRALGLVSATVHIGEGVK